MYYNARAFPFPRKLRRDQTEVEKKIWSLLRNNQMGCKFRRQHPVGKYIADFVCLEKKLIIEMDGGQHNVEVDKERTEFLSNSGYQILRFWNSEVVESIDGVYDRIIAALEI